MIFLRDLIIRVSFKVSFPHLYFLEVWRSWMGLCYKRQYKFSSVCVCCFKYTFFPTENYSGDTFTTSIILYSLSLLWNSVLFFLLNVGRDEFVLSRRRASSSTNPVFTPMMTRKKVRVSEGLFNAFNIRLTSRNVFSEFFIIHTAYESHAQRKALSDIAWHPPWPDWLKNLRILEDFALSLSFKECYRSVTSRLWKRNL